MFSAETVTQTPQVYYRTPGVMTTLDEYAPWFENLPADVPSLVQIVQGLMLHIFWAERYGYTMPSARQSEVGLRTVPQKMKRLFELDSAPLTTPRPIERRLIGNCRDFTVMLCAMLQSRGVPARARCGFGTYFMPNHYEDHWVCEYWNADQKRWVMVDAQLDSLQRNILQIGFDTLDLPTGQFVTGGDAWLRVRAGKADPAQFGIFDMHGIAFIRGDLVRDFMALNKIEILPWDPWGHIVPDDTLAATQDADQMDEMSRLSLAGDDQFGALRTFYEKELILHPAPDWKA